MDHGIPGKAIQTDRWNGRPGFGDHGKYPGLVQGKVREFGLSMNVSLENQTQTILDSIADGVFTVDSDFRITSFNRAAEKITGIRKKEAVGRHCWEVFRASICEE